MSEGALVPAARFGAAWPRSARIALGLCVGGAGGLLAYIAHVPLAFMLGALFACMAASLARWPVEVPPTLRSIFMLVVGAFLGESFTPDTIERMAEWPLTIALAILYVPVASWVGWMFYARFANLDRLTALFSAIPGGLSAVVLFSGALGGDEKRVALSHSLRISVVVVTAPTVVFGILGFAYDGDALASGASRPIELVECLWLALGTAALYGALLLLRAPLPFLVAPMLASAALRIAGVVDGALPIWLVDAALVVVGGSIGCRFAGADPRQLLSLAGWTLAGTWLLMALAGLFGLLASAIADVDLDAALLAFAPGGVAEMCLIALALGADPGFVAAHHIARILFILLLTPFIAGWLVKAGLADAPAPSGGRREEGGG